MAWGGVWLEDQAFMGYDALLPVGGKGGYASHTEAVWNRMVLGWSALSTQVDILDCIQSNELVLWAKKGVGEAWRLMQPGELRLWDGLAEHGATRITSVYTGDSREPSGWYRRL
jgi:hypothetical protein